MNEFEEKGVYFVFMQDNIDTTTAMEHFFFQMLASIAELEHDIISERTKNGLNAARARITSCLKLKQPQELKLQLYTVI